MVRLDDRLLHGQVAYSLKSALNYDVIVIADNDVVNDEIRKEALKLCKPDDVRISIRDIDGAIKVVTDERVRNMKILVIVKNPKSAYEFYEKLSKLNNDLPKFNLGGMQMEEGRKMISNALYMNTEELQYIDKIYQMNVNIEIQLVPNSPMIKYEDIRK